MFKEIHLCEIEQDGLLHSTVEECIFDSEKTFILQIDFIRLKIAGYFYSCTITISDWWDLEVTEKGSKVNHKYALDAMPTDIEQIVKYVYEDEVLTLKACGYLDIDSNIYYRFTKPRIQITGEYEPD